MAAATDPARELAEVCDKLSVGDGHRGDQFLATQFGVKPWSQEFYQIIFCIIERADYVSNLLEILELDDDFKQDARNHTEEIKKAFSYESLGSPWNTIGIKYLNKQNIQPMKMLSAQIRQKVSYPKLDQAEIDEVILIVSELEQWLSEHQINDNDFIRQVLLDGVKQFRFRFERLNWLGWGYTIASLRDVIGAYFALEKGVVDPNINPDAGAVLMKVRTFLEQFYEKAKFSKDVYATGDFLLKMYGAASLALHGASATGVINLLGKP